MWFKLNKLFGNIIYLEFGVDKEATKKNFKKFEKFVIFHKPNLRDVTLHMLNLYSITDDVK